MAPAALGAGVGLRTAPPRPVRLRPLVLCSALALALAACAAPPAVVTVPVPAPPPVAAPALPPRPEPAPPTETPPESPSEPPAPLPAPEGTVESRRLYPQGGEVAEVAEWVLGNGATVVYAFHPDAESAWVVALGAGGEVLADAGAPTVEDALALVRRTAAPPGAVTAVVVGGQPSLAVEEPVGRTLGGRRSSGRTEPASAAPPPGALTVSADLDDDGALLVLAEVLRRRVGPVRLTVDPSTRTATFVREAGAGWDGALGPVPRAEAEAAREAVVAEAARAPEAFAARALADLWRAPGARRPARDPAFALDRLGRVQSVSPRTLSALAARLSALPR